MHPAMIYSPSAPYFLIHYLLQSSCLILEYRTHPSIHPSICVWFLSLIFPKTVVLPHRVQFSGMVHTVSELPGRLSDCHLQQSSAVNFYSHASIPCLTSPLSHCSPRNHLPNKQLAPKLLSKRSVWGKTKIMSQKHACFLQITTTTHACVFIRASLCSLSISHL